MSESSLRAAIIATALRMNALRINQGQSGNVSARSSGIPSAAGRLDAAAATGATASATDGFLITPSGLPYEDTAASDVSWMPLAAPDERAAVGPRLPSSEWRFHRDIYRARPDVGAIVHTHGVYATTLACLNRGIPAFHYMVAAAGGADVRCAPYATFGTPELSDHALAALDGRRACLLAQHGMIATGATLAAAFALAVEVETLAQMYWQALQIAEPPVLSGDEMSRVIEKFRHYGQPSGA